MSDNVAAHKASAKCDSSLEPHAAESRGRAAALRFLGKGLSTSQCRPPSEQRWQLLRNSVSRRQCVNQKTPATLRNLLVVALQQSRSAVGAYGSIKVITAESGLYLGDQQGVNGLQQQGYVCVAARRELSAG